MDYLRKQHRERHSCGPRVVFGPVLGSLVYLFSPHTISSLFQDTHGSPWSAENGTRSTPPDEPKQGKYFGSSDLSGAPTQPSYVADAGNNAGFDSSLTRRSVLHTSCREVHRQESCAFLLKNLLSFSSAKTRRTNFGLSVV